MYDPISPNVNFVEQEKKIEKFWRDEKIFEKSIEERKDGRYEDVLAVKVHVPCVVFRVGGTDYRRFHRATYGRDRRLSIDRHRRAPVVPDDAVCVQGAGAGLQGQVPEGRDLNRDAQRR